MAKTKDEINAARRAKRAATAAARVEKWRAASEERNRQWEAQNQARLDAIKCFSDLETFDNDYSGVCENPDGDGTYVYRDEAEVLVKRLEVRVKELEGQLLAVSQATCGIR